MGVTKSEIFSDKQNRLAGMMKALAHPARIAIIQRLLKANACICGDLVGELGLAQPTISQHLKEEDRRADSGHNRGDERMLLYRSEDLGAVSEGAGSLVRRL